MELALYLTIYTLSQLFAILEYVELPSWSLPRVCFEPATEFPASDHRITCQFAHPGQFPPKTATMTKIFPRCCFWGAPETGVFWAIGESVISPIMTVFGDIPEADAQPAFQTTKVPVVFEKSEPLSILVSDLVGDMVIPDARVTLSDESVHLVAQTQYTDGNGYAVLSVIPHLDYALAIHADGYLSPPPIKAHRIPGEVEEYLVELDMGLELTGTVVDDQERPIPNALIHVEAHNEKSSWNSDIDRLEHPYLSDKNGQFDLAPIPRGQIQLYATHDAFAPSSIVELDASDNEVFEPLKFTLKPPVRALLRVEDALHTAIPAQLTIFDEPTGTTLAQEKSPNSGALELKNLSQHVRILVQADGYQPKTIVQKVSENGEILVTLDREQNETFAFILQNIDGLAIENAHITPIDDEVRQKNASCRAQSDATGRATLDHCPDAFKAIIAHPDYTPLEIALDRSKRTHLITLEKGRDVRIATTDGTSPVPVTCTLKTAASTRTLSAPNGIIELHHLPEITHEITCTASANRTQNATFTPSNSPATLVFPAVLTRPCVVLDSLGAPVHYARVDTSTTSLETDEQGRLELTTLPHASLDVYHWLHGHLHTTFEPGSDLLELRLPDHPDEKTLECLQNHDIPFQIDSAAILLNATDKKRHFERGDFVESCNAHALVIIRDVYRMKLPWREDP